MIRLLIGIFALLFTWLMLGMILTNHFIPPFNLLIQWIMPWKRLMAMPENGDLLERLIYMQRLLDMSNTVSRIASFMMVFSFAILIVYLTYVYQLKQRRSHENRLLKIKNQEIARRNEFIQFISATIGHEFKNNLGRIKRRLDLLRGLNIDSKKRIYDNLNKLFADIDIFKKISDKREEGLIDFSKINLQELLLAQLKHNSDLLCFTIEENPPPPQIFASATLITTVFENLIDNAIKYKKNKKKKACIKAAFTIDADGKRKYVTLLFKDEGIGMDKVTADHCFYKGKSGIDGWGQGLYFVKYAIGLHAGKIRVGKEYTEPGVGSEIIINLPYVEEAFDV